MKNKKKSKMKSKMKEQYILAWWLIGVIILIIIAWSVWGSANTNTTTIVEPVSQNRYQETSHKEVESETKTEVATENNDNNSYTLRSSKWNIITINNFSEMETISSPLTLTWRVPTNWVFEWIFWINLYNNKWELVKEWYGTANIFDDKWDVILWEVDFTASIDFESENITNTWILRLSADNPSSIVQNEDMVETVVTF